MYKIKSLYDNILATLILGTCNPCNIRNRDNYLGYKFNDFDRRYFRIFTIIASRDSEDQVTVPMYFDGAVNEFEPLPPPDHVNEMQAFTKLVNRNRNYVIYIPPELTQPKNTLKVDKPKVSLMTLFTKKHKRLINYN